MKMNIAAMLEYQASDQIIYKAEQAFANSPENRRYAAVQNKIAEIRQAVIKMDKDAVDARREIEKREAQCAEITSELTAGLDFGYEDDLTAVKKHEDVLQEYESTVDRIEKDVNKFLRRLEEIEREVKQASQQLKKCTIDFEQSKAELAKKRTEMQNQLKDEVLKRREIQQKLNREELDLYKKVRKENIRLPILVEYSDGLCRGCGMHVENDLHGKLKESGDIAECPNCRRILYLK